MTGRTDGTDDAPDGASRPAIGADPSDAPISYSLILRTALAIIDRDGVGCLLSMRRRSDAVERESTVLYRHLPSKAAVLDGVAEIVLSQLSVDTTDRGLGGHPAGVVAHHFRALALEHPNVVPLLVTRPLAIPLGQRPPGTLRPLEDVLTLLNCAGFIGDDALQVYRVLFGYLTATSSRTAGDRRTARGNGSRHEARSTSAVDRRIPPNAYLAPALASYDSAAELDRGLDILLFAGLTATLGLSETVPDGDLAARSKSG